MDWIWPVGLALVGAGAGAFGAWIVGRLRDRERDETAARTALQEKVHQLEIRIVRMEHDLAFYLNAGTRRVKEGLDAQQG